MVRGGQNRRGLRESSSEAVHCSEGAGCSPAGVQLDAEEILEMGEEELYMVGGRVCESSLSVTMPVCVTQPPHSSPHRPT